MATAEAADRITAMAIEGMKVGKRVQENLNLPSPKFFHADFYRRFLPIPKYTRQTSNLPAKPGPKVYSSLSTW